MLPILIFVFGIIFCYAGIFTYLKGSRRHYQREVTRTMHFHGSSDDTPPRRLEPPEDLNTTIGDVLAWARSQAKYEPVRDYVSEGIDAILNPRDTYEPSQPAMLDKPHGQTAAPATDYSMNSGPDGIIVLRNGMLTVNERRELERQWQEGFDKGKVIVLPAGAEYHAIKRPEGLEAPFCEEATSIGIGKRRFWARYIEPIGYITSDTEEKLHRACEVALQDYFKQHESMMRAYDRRIRSAMSVPSAVQDDLPDRLREKRLHEWELCKKALEILTALNAE